jgi:hypothetical protein
VEDSDCVTISCCGEKADELVEEFGYGAPESLFQTTCVKGRVTRSWMKKVEMK